MDVCGKSRPHPDSIPGPPTLYTDYAIPAWQTETLTETYKTTRCQNSEHCNRTYCNKNSKILEGTGNPSKGTKIGRYGEHKTPCSICNSSDLQEVPHLNLMPASSLLWRTHSLCSLSCTPHVSDHHTIVTDERTIMRQTNVYHIIHTSPPKFQNLETCGRSGLRHRGKSRSCTGHKEGEERALHQEMFCIHTHFLYIC